MIDQISQEFGFLQKAVGLREQRMEVLSTNIANADTPNYKARDFNFSQALAKATGAGGSMSLPAVNLNLTSSRHIPAAATQFNMDSLQYRIPHQPSIDGNTVEMDTERTAFVDNTMKQQANLTLLNNRIRALQTAMQPG